MKVQCDVCEKAQATILCCADEASLCRECDTRVHAANKLASKHQRVPLSYPSSKDLPRCDICQEKTGYFLCLEDRAILCRNCDYSIHSRNTLAAKHKRYLVSGVSVGLQAITASESSDSIQACSLSHVSSSTTHASQLSSPTTQPTQLSLPKNTRPQTSASLNPLPCKDACLVPPEISSFMKERGLSKVPPSTKQEQQQRSTLARVNEDEGFGKVSSLSTANEEQRVQQIMLASSQQKSQAMPTGVLPCKRVGAPLMCLTPASINQQGYLNEGHLPSKFGTHSYICNDADDLHRTDLVTPKGSACTNGGSSISEYLTESIPGWKLDEVLNLMEFDAIYNYAEPCTSKTDAGTADVDWPVECSMNESEGLGEMVAAEVPRMQYPPTASGVPRLTKPWGFGKSLKESDLGFFLCSEESLIVPDIEGVPSLTALSPPSLPQKRRRPSEVW